eukprot:g10057.t1
MPSRFHLTVVKAWVTLFYDLIQLTQLRILGVFRLSRIVGRIVRMMKTPKALRRARTMMIAVLNSFVDLFWSILVIALILFAYGVFLSEGAVAYFGSLGPGGNLTGTQQEDAAKVKDYFGSMHAIMVSLWAAVSGGNESWNMVQHERAEPICGQPTVKVHSEQVLVNYREDLANEIEDFKKVLKTTDIDQDGKVSYKELAETLKHAESVAFWSSLHLNPQEADGNHL